MTPADHVAEQFMRTKTRTSPFRHIFVEDVFPPDFYSRLRSELPGDEGYARISAHDKKRLIASGKMAPSLLELRSERMARSMLTVLEIEASGRFEVETRLVRDGEGCHLAPHRDAPWRLLSAIFYLPAEARYSRHGTSVYVPKGDGFERVWTAPFLPNACFAISNDANAWHGVEPVDEDFSRDLLMYNINDPALRPPRRPRP